MTESRTPQSRRRGAELEEALLRAALGEIAEVGYGRLTMEGVAARASTGKAAVYRRWSDKHDLVLAALQHVIPRVPEPDPDRSVRENLRAMLSTLGGVLAGRSDVPAISLIADMLREPALRDGFVEGIIQPRLNMIESMLRHAESTGEIPAGRLGPFAAVTGPALLLHSLLLTGQSPGPDDVDRVVDTVLGADHDT